MGRRDPISLGLNGSSEDPKGNNTELTDEESRERLKTLRDKLKEVIFGQDTAIDALVSALYISHAGLRKKDKLVGSFLFLGPTGSGKTEVTVQLAKLLGYQFLRIDMSEFKHGHEVARLVGSPPGYIGHDEPGQLTSFVAKNPKCIILLDEIEKAHPDAFDLLLQVMDYAKLTDGKNKTIDFSKAILIMTSNLGAAQKQKGPVGIDIAVAGSDKAHRDARNDVMMRKVFSPEFRNRLDEVIEFGELPMEVIVKVVDKFLKELAEQLEKKNVKVEVSPEARQYIAEKGFDKQMGARPLDRFITKEVRKKIAPEILFGKLENGGEVKIGLAFDQASGKQSLSFVFNAAANDNKPPQAPGANPNPNLPNRPALPPRRPSSPAGDW